MKYFCPSETLKLILLLPALTGSRQYSKRTPCSKVYNILIKTSGRLTLLSETNLNESSKLISGFEPLYEVTYMVKLSYWLTVKVAGKDFGFLKSILIKEFFGEENLPTEITGKETDKK